MSHSVSRALASLAIAAGLATSGCGGGPSAGPRSATTTSAPDFSLPTIDGKTARLSSYLDGKHVVLLDFWSTTCDPCMVEMPHLVELYEAKKDQGFVVLAISLDGPESRAQVSSTVHDKAMSFPVLLDEETTVVARYNPKREMPFAVLIGKDGSILQKRGGYTPGDEKLLAAEVDKALAEP